MSKIEELKSRLVNLKNVLNAVKEVFVEDEELRNKLSRTGGIISLALTFIETYDKVKDKFKSEDEKIAARVVKVVLESIKDLEDLENVEIDGNEFFDLVFESIKEGNLDDWDGDPSTFLEISKVDQKMREIFDKNGIAKNKFYIKFIQKFSEEFEDYYKGLEEVKREIKFSEHLERMIKLKDESLTDEKDDPPIKKYYVPSYGYLNDISEWGTELNRESKIAEKIIDDFLKDDTSKILLVGTEFGVGKSTLTKMVAARYAESWSEEHFVPVYIRLGGLLNVKEIDDEIDKVKINNFQKILLLLDGFDELKHKDELIQHLPEIVRNENIKIVITSRFGVGEEFKDLLKVYRQQNEKYLHLQKFTDEQVNEWFNKIGSKLNVNKLKELGIKEEEYRKPIYLYLIWRLDKEKEIEKIVSKKKSRNYREAKLYLTFTNEVSRLKAKLVKSKEYKEFEIVEKGASSKESVPEKLEMKARKLLIHLAALKSFYGKIDEDFAKEKLEEDVRKIFEELGWKYLITTYIHPKEYVFIHKSFQEYLIAEYLFTSFLEGKKYRLNLSVSRETIEFLKGLVEIFVDDLKNNRMDELKEIIAIAENSDNEIMFNKLTKEIHSDNIKILLEKLADRAYNWVFDERVYFKGYKAKKIHDVVELEADLSLLWIERWISLIIGKRLTDRFGKLKKEEKEMLAKLIRFSQVESFLKDLANIDLSEANLSGANLIGADLSNVNLSRAYLSKANLSRAYLGGADLSGANLIGANLSWAYLGGADLSRAYLIDVNLIWAYLIEAYLSGAVIISDCESNYRDTKVKEADFENAIINNEKLVEYLRKNGAINVPDAITDEDEIVRILKERGYPKHIINYVEYILE